MGRNPAWLNPKQVGVLEWIRDGCRGSHASDAYQRRITARALERRGLVRIQGRGGSWTASLTEAGLAWFMIHTEPTPTDAEVEALICSVLAAGGRLELPVRDGSGERWKQLVKLSERSEKRGLAARGTTHRPLE